MISLTEVTSALSIHTINIIYISYYNASVLTQSNKRICKQTQYCSNWRRKKQKQNKAKKKTQKTEQLFGKVKGEYCGDWYDRRIED